MKYPSLEKYVPYAQELLRLTINAETDMDVIIGIDIKVHCLELNDWVMIHYNGEKFSVYDKDGGELLVETFCRE